MKDFREAMRSAFYIPYFGHTFTLHNKPAPFDLLNEWLVLDLSEIARVTTHSTISFQPPHVIVFDMDSTLITEEEEVRIRDPRVYDSLYQLRQYNCLLCLWSYGDREHVVESMKKTKLDGYFDVVLAEGNYEGVYSVRESSDRNYNKHYTATPFYLNVAGKELLPKSPRVILWYLQQRGVNFIKTITLVDDLPDNDYCYDNFVNLDRCPEPVDDWHIWYNKIVEFINHYDMVTRHYQTT